MFSDYNHWWDQELIIDYVQKEGKENNKSQIGEQPLHNKCVYNTKRIRPVVNGEGIFFFLSLSLSLPTLDKQTHSLSILLTHLHRQWDKFFSLSLSLSVFSSSLLLFALLCPVLLTKRDFLHFHFYFSSVYFPTTNTASRSAFLILLLLFLF